MDTEQVKADASKVSTAVTAEASKAATAFKSWVPLGDHRWYVWIAVAGFVGFVLARCTA